MRFVLLREDRSARLIAGVAGSVLFAGAGLALDLAREHMEIVGTICGASPSPHCGWCYGAAALVLSGLAAFFVALSPAPTSVRAGSR